MSTHLSITYALGWPFIQAASLSGQKLKTRIGENIPNDSLKVSLVALINIKYLDSYSLSLHNHT